MTRYEKDYHRRFNPRAKQSVRIYDVFTFFNCAFTKAYQRLTGHDPGDVVTAGKKARGEFTVSDLAYVERYWKSEIQQVKELAETLRERLYSAGLYITQWHGPGALASYVNRQHGIKKHMAVCPPEVREAARYAYAGGRFERLRLGRASGPIYSLDINSAYPYAISLLPSLATGVWSRVLHPKRIASFGVYRIRLLPRVGGSFLDRTPGPLFHRDKMGNISFPWVLEGWYWSPEILNVVRHVPREQYEIVEGWEYTDWQNSERPFAHVPEMYELRQRWKAEDNESEIALKLALNSLYGKMAQRVGWNESNGTAPTWHQLEWAGWVTSKCRAMLWDAMRKAGFDNVIAVETDGLYITVPPTTVLGNDGGPIRDNGSGGEYGSNSTLGGWKVDRYDEILYVQSGLAWLRDAKGWHEKRRGLDAKAFQLDDCRNYLHSLRAKEKWEPFVGLAHRFIGMGAALQSNQSTHDRLGVWVDNERFINPGVNGKRVHIITQCAACKEGLSAYDGLHDMTIRSLAYLPDQTMSKPHDIPWENGDLGYEWRARKELADGYISGMG